MKHKLSLSVFATSDTHHRAATAGEIKEAEYRWKQCSVKEEYRRK
jgi:hypothetical protein